MACLDDSVEGTLYFHQGEKPWVDDGRVQGQEAFLMDLTHQEDQVRSD